MKLAYFAIFLIILGIAHPAYSETLDCNQDTLVKVKSPTIDVYHQLALARDLTCGFSDAAEHYDLALKSCKDFKLQEEILRELALIHIFRRDLSSAEKCCLIDIPNLDEVSCTNRMLDLAAVRYLQGNEVGAQQLVLNAKRILKRKNGIITLPFSRILWSKAEERRDSIRSIDYSDYAFEAIRFQKSLIGEVNSAWLRRLSEFYSAKLQRKDVARNLLNEALKIDQSSKFPRAENLVVLDRKLLTSLNKKERVKPMKNTVSSEGYVCNLSLPLIDWSKTGKN